MTRRTLIAGLCHAVGAVLACVGDSSSQAWHVADEVTVPAIVWCTQVTVPKNVLDTPKVSCRYVVFLDWPSCPPIPRVRAWRWTQGRNAIDVLSRSPRSVAFLERDGERTIFRRVRCLWQHNVVCNYDLEVANQCWYSAVQRRGL